MFVRPGPCPARSDELGAFLVVVREGATVRLRIARDAAGNDVVPTAEEAKQTAEEGKRAAEERVRALEAELERRRGAK